MGELTDDEVMDLTWLSRQTKPVWGGLYEPTGKSHDPDIARWCASGLVAPVARPYRVGHAHFDGGYAITEAGRAALRSREAKDG